MVKGIFHFFFFFLYSITIGAQDKPFCAFDKILQGSKKLDKQLIHAEQTTIRSDEVLHVRTVVHVVYSKPKDNITDKFIQSLIGELNLKMSAQNVDPREIHADHRSLLADTKIRFCLAESDPDGNQTSGITHTKTKVDFFNPDFFNSPNVTKVSEGGKSHWDTKKYLNIWIAPIHSDSTWYNYGTPNKYYSPYNSGLFDLPEQQGAVLDVNAINQYSSGRVGTASASDILTHEIGHTLGLFHTWGRQVYGDSIEAIENCEFDDLIDDTPLCKPSTKCRGNLNTCVDEFDDKVDNGTNIMSYGCPLMFTPGQVKAMRSNLINVSPDLILKESPCTDYSIIPDLKRSEEYKLEIYPNPSIESFNVEFTNQRATDISIDIYDSAGKIVLSETRYLTKYFIEEYDAATFESGVYIIIITTDKQVLTRKIVISD